MHHIHKHWYVRNEDHKCKSDKNKKEHRVMFDWNLKTLKPDRPANAHHNYNVMVMWCICWTYHMLSIRSHRLSPIPLLYFIYWFLYSWCQIKISNVLPRSSLLTHWSYGFFALTHRYRGKCLHLFWRQITSDFWSGVIGNCWLSLQYVERLGKNKATLVCYLSTQEKHACV